jgi:Mg-chelatase subunit ChlD
MRLALDRYGLTEVLADENLIETIEPDINLLRALLATKGVVPGSVLAAVRRLVRRVADQLTEKLRIEVLSCFTGARNRAQRSRTPLAKNFDPWTTIRRNLKHYQIESQSLVIERAYFHSRLQRRTPWDLLLVVDQSGSMADSVIHSAVLAGIFGSLPMLRTRLILFDTAVVDLTEHARDPVEVLMRVQLGGGTDIAGALEYAASWVRNPRRTILVLVTDFYEGGTLDDLYAVAGRLVESGVTCLGLAALDERAEPAFERAVADRLARLGMQIAAMTPDRLADWVSRIVRG